MKKHLSLLLIVSLFCGLCACGAAPGSPEQTAAQTEPPKEVRRTLTTISAAELNGRIKLFGRTAIVDRGISCDFSASGFEFKVNCEGDITFHVTSNSTSNTYFRAYLDGVESERRYAITRDFDMPVFKAVEPGEHTISFIRDTSVADRDVFIEGITMTCDPATIEATPDKELLIEFVGTSNTCASGVLCIDTTTNSNNEAATRGYAYLTARALDTDWMLTCKGGIGVAKEVKNGRNTLNLRQLYDTAYGFRDPDTPYQWTRHPDIVVLEVGPNDKLVGDAFVDVCLEMVDHVRTLHPDCKILFLHAEESTKHTKDYPVILEKLGGSANKIWDCTTPNEGRSALDGIHRNVEQNQACGEFVTAFIRDNLLS